MMPCKRRTLRRKPQKRMTHVAHSARLKAKSLPSQV